MSNEGNGASAAAAGGTVYVWHPKVACRTLDGTAFVLAGSHMVSLNGTGSRVWDLLEAGTTAAGIAEQLTDEYEVSFEAALRDAEGFLQALLARHMVLVRPAHDPSRQAATGGAP